MQRTWKDKGLSLRSLLVTGRSSYGENLSCFLKMRFRYLILEKFGTDSEVIAYMDFSASRLSSKSTVFFV